MTRPQSGYLRDPRFVRAQYASEDGLVARRSIYSRTTGPFAGDVAFDAVREAAPARLLEVGCGTGWFAARVARELPTDVVAVDQSERMVNLTREQGVDALVADVQELPFATGSFDCVAANWMLYHVPDLDRGLSELARVLSRGGRLVAVTNAQDHLVEVWRAVGADQERLSRELSFNAENGADMLSRHFGQVEVRPANGTVEIESREAVVRYLESTDAWRPYAERVPEDLPVPFTARRANVVFVATR